VANELPPKIFNNPTFGILNKPKGHWRNESFNCSCTQHRRQHAGAQVIHSTSAMPWNTRSVRYIAWRGIHRTLPPVRTPIYTV